MDKEERMLLIIPCAIIFSIGMIAGIFIGYKYYEPKYPDTTVSIEYYSTCQCGNKKMECYKSFVDGYEYKECKECGSYYDNKGDK